MKKIKLFENWEEPTDQDYKMKEFTEDEMHIAMKEMTKWVLYSVENGSIDAMPFEIASKIIESIRENRAGSISIGSHENIWKGLSLTKTPAKWVSTLSRKRM